MKNGVKRTTITMDDATRAIAERLCEEDDRSLTSIVRLAINHLAKCREECRDNAKQAA